MKCPKCGYENPAEAVVCGLCTEIFRKGKDEIREESTRREQLKKVPTGILLFIAGLVLYPLIHHIYFLDLMCSYFTILVHELGHSIIFLIFGQLALPKLDFVYGGGMAVAIFISGKTGLFLIMVLLLLFIYLSRKDTRLMICLIVLVIVYPIFAFTRGQDILILAAGHLCEIVAAGICFYRCLIAGRAQPFERPIYAVLGWWITLHGIGFFWRLATNMSARSEYINDPVKYHDLIRIADITNWNFGFVATIFMLAFFIPVILMIVLLVWKMTKKTPWTETP
jgi:hypothetical protein